MIESVKKPYRMNDAAKEAQKRLLRPTDMKEMIQEMFVEKHQRTDELAALLVQHLPAKDLKRVSALLRKGIDTNRLRGIFDQVI